MTTLFVGIDIGKSSHVAGFLSGDLLARYGRFDRCPSLPFPQSRAGLLSLLARIRSYQEDPSQVAILLEHTGHYHRALEEALLSAGLTVYIIAVHARRANGLDKTDKTDALRLANLLYAQIGLGLQVTEVAARVQRRLPPTAAALRLRGLVGRRHELVDRQVAVRNKLTAIADELFPELRLVFRDVNGESARLVRERFPTPAQVAAASLAELRQVRRRSTPSEAKLAELQRLSAESLGTCEPGRVHGLVTEQRQLLEEMRLILRHLEELEAEIREVCIHERAGQILLSIPGIGLIATATLLGAMGTIDNFERASLLRKFCGWAPQKTQTGTSVDAVYQTRTGVRLLRQTLFMVVMSSLTQDDTEWARLYRRLVPQKCSYDPRTKTYTGKMRVVGRVAGQIIGVIWTLLSRDAQVCREYAARGEAPPPPVLYDREVHRKHREGGAGHVVE